MVSKNAPRNLTESHIMETLPSSTWDSMSASEAGNLVEHQDPRRSYVFRGATGRHLVVNWNVQQRSWNVVLYDEASTEVSRTGGLSGVFAVKNTVNQFVNFSSV